MNTSTINHTSVLVRGSMTPTYVSAGTAFAFSTSGNAVTITPDIQFKPNEIITVQVTTAVAAANGTHMAKSQTWSFRAKTPVAGNQTWTNSSNYFGESYGLATGDFDNDGWVDFAVSKISPTSTIEVYTNNKNSSFTLSTTRTTSGPVLGMDVADVNSDGNLDIIAGIDGIEEFAVLLGQGDGDFDPTITIASNSSSNSVSAADFTGDGIIDVLTSESQGVGNSSLYVGDNTGSFTFYSNLTTVDIRDAVAADFDADGDLDAVAGTDGDVHLNNGSGNFTRSAGSATTSMANIEVGDIDGDGDADIVAGTIADGSASRYISIGKNNGSGVFSMSTAPTVSVTEGFKSANLFDYDGDGDLDIMGLYDNSTSTLLLNDGSGNFSGGGSIAFITSIKRVRLFDLNNDGDLDIITTRGSNGFEIRYGRRTPEISFSGASAATPLTAVGTASVTSATLSFAGLTGAISLSSDSPRLALSTNNSTFAASLNFTNRSSINSSQTVYIRYTPTTTAAFSGVVTASSGVLSTTLPVTGSAYSVVPSPQALSFPITRVSEATVASVALYHANLPEDIFAESTSPHITLSANGTTFSTSVTLSAGSPTPLLVRFGPVAVTAGTTAVNISSGLYSTSLSLSLQSVPLIDLSVQSIVFPLMPLTSSATTSLSISTAGLESPVQISAPLSAYTVSSDGTTFSSSATLYTGAAATSQTIYIRYTPTTTAVFSSVVTAEAGSVSTTVSVSGSAYSVVPSPQAFSFPITRVSEATVASVALYHANLPEDIFAESTSPHIMLSSNGTVFSTSVTLGAASPTPLFVRFGPVAVTAGTTAVNISSGLYSTSLSLSLQSIPIFELSTQSTVFPVTSIITTATTSLSLSAVGLQLPIELSVAGNAFAVSTNGTVFSSSATLPASSSSATVYIRFAPDNFGAFNGTLSAVSGIYSTSAALSGQGSIPSNMVTNTNDSGPGSLRLALESATAGTVLVFTTGTNPTFVLSSGPITISHPIVADLTALGTITIDGGGGTAIQLDCGAVGMQLRGVQIVNTPPGISVRSICPAVRGAVIQNQ